MDEDIERSCGLRRLLLINDGAADFDAEGNYCHGAYFLPGWSRLLAAAEIAEESQGLVEILGQLDMDLTGWWWDPQWIKFGRNVGADGLAIDQRPGLEQGAVGQFNHEDHACFDRPPSIDAFIARVAESLETGSGISCFRPAVVEGRLDWDVIVT